MSIEAEKNAAFVKGLRKLAALYEKNLELPTPYLPFQINIYPPDTKEAIAAVAKILAPFKAQKLTDDIFFRVAADLDGVRLNAAVYREQVCERKQVGTKTY